MGQAFPSSSEVGVQIFQSRVIINVHFDHYNEGFRLFSNSVQDVNCQFSEMHLSNGKPQQFPHSNSSDIYMHYRLSFTFVCKCNSAGTVFEWPLNSIQKNKFFNLTRMHMTNKRLVVRSQHGLLKLIFINTPSAGQYHSQEN